MSDPNAPYPGSPYEQPAYGEQPYGQQPSGQPAYGQQPPYEGQPVYGQPSYGAPYPAGVQPYVSPVNPGTGYAGYPVPVKSSSALSLAGMIIGFASLFFGFTLIVPVVGLVLSFIGLSKEPQAKGMSITGIIFNGLNLVGWGLVVLVGMAGVLGLAYVR